MTENTNPNALIDADAGDYLGDYRNVWFKIYANHNCAGGQIIISMDPEDDKVVV